MTTKYITRFAPSPTGPLHLGHAWSAITAHDLARRKGGRFVLRIEDIDEARCRAEFVDGIYTDLRWLGLDWDGDVMVQSARRAAFDAALGRLQATGLVYRCWCTRAEVAASAAAPQGETEVTYPGTCRGRRDPGSERPYCWRLDVATALAVSGELDWEEVGTGRVVAQPLLLGDVVIARKDAATSYHLAVTIDDAAQGVTDVVRGRDLFMSTHIHRLLQALLELPAPRYHHHPLVVGTDGERLAKRRNAPTLAAMRAAGTDGLRLAEGLRAGRFPFGFTLEQV
jgi:glutamyl-Q tRNA(Asp) synthetase